MENTACYRQSCNDNTHSSMFSMDPKKTSIQCALYRTHQKKSHGSSGDGDNARLTAASHILCGERIKEISWQLMETTSMSCSSLALAAQQLVLVYATCQCDFWQNLIRTQLWMDRLLAKTNVQSILNGNITLYIQLQ